MTHQAPFGRQSAIKGVATGIGRGLCAVGSHDWVDAPQEAWELLSDAYLPAKLLQTKKYRVPRTCARPDCEAKDAVEREERIPHPELADIDYEHLHVETASDARCQRGEHEYDDPPVESFGSLKQRRFIRCQRDGCGNSFFQFRELTPGPWKQLG